MMKKVLENLKDSFKKYITNHIGTNIVLLLITLTILVIEFEDPSEFVQRFLITLFLTAMFTLLGETFTKDNKKRYSIYGIGLLISIITSKCILKEELLRYLLGIILSVGFTILYLMARNRKESSNKFLTSTATSLFKLGIIGSVLNMGIMSIIGLISTLLIELDEIIFVKTEIIFLVLYYIPALIISLETEEEENKFIYSLVNYVALPLISIATTIIYLYILKLLVTFKLPHTATFAINAILLSCGIPVLLMIFSYEKDTIMKKVANILKKLFIPLVLLQIFSLSIRIYNYGITTSRYFGIILILLGIISIVLLNKDNGKNYKLILLPCILISIVSCMFPYINIFDYPNYNQIDRLKQILPENKPFNSLTKKEKEDVKSIYYYVYDKKYYPSYLPKEKLGSLIGDYYTDPKNSNYLSYYSPTEKINVTAYKEMEEYSAYSNDGFTISIKGKDYNLEEYLESIYTYSRESNDLEEYMEKNKLLEINDNMDLYITSLQFDYLDNYVTIDGYILYK